MVLIYQGGAAGAGNGFYVQYGVDGHFFRWLIVNTNTIVPLIPKDFPHLCVVSKLNTTLIGPK
jgi:hypothetical protein